MSPFLLACLTLPEPEALPELSREVFAEEVQPVLGPSCAAPGCHGDPSRPLELYQPGWHRRDPDRRFVDEALSPEELESNFVRSRAFVRPVPEESLLVRKALATEHGGVSHDSGPIWLDTYETDYQTVLWWAAGGEP